ncbi:MAG: flavin reductase family protein [Candidatus Eisenbacteria bacterium]|nr:flavin reductase family protein [Candidatus Eisenbacteria bacterium]
MAKRSLDVRKVTGLVNHGPTVLASCRHGGKSNLITLAWTTCVSADPPMIAVAIAPVRFSHGLISRSGEFVLNVPSSDLLPAVWHCGTISGRDGDKFASSGLTEAPASMLDVPLVAECFAHIECRVAAAPVLGDHTLFVGEIMAATAEDEAFDGRLKLQQPYHTLHHLGGRDFVTTAGSRLRAA